MKKIYRDGVEHGLDVGSTPSVKITRDGHVIESWMSGGKRVYFANLKDSVYCAHGDTIAQAVGDAIFKDPAKRPSIDALIAEIKPVVKTRKITVQEFIILTGACLTGCRDFLNNKGLSQTVSMTLDDFMPIGGEWATRLKKVLSD